jgi:transposase
LSAKIHLLADENGLPLEFRITAGQAGEYGPAAELLRGRCAEAVIADWATTSTFWWRNRRTSVRGL